jgi:acetolactate synthase-1/2/3 large subunit
MANGRRIGVAAVQHGPGAEAAFAAMAQAYGDRTPLLLVPSAYDRSEQGHGPNFDAAEAYRPISAWATTLNDVARTHETFRRAFQLLRSRRSGPVVVAVADDVLHDEAPSDGRYEATRAYRAAADPADVEDALRRLVAARRPVLFAGQGVLYAEAADELRQLAERTGAAVVTTLNGKSAFREDHPLALGTGARSRPGPVDRFLAAADLVLGVGTSFTRSTYTTRVPAGAVTGLITDDAADLGSAPGTSFGCLGDAKLVLGQMLELLDGGDVRADPERAATTAAEIARERAAFLATWSPRLESDDAPISPYRVIAELGRVLDRTRAVVTHDAGNPRDQMTPFYESVVPRGYLGWGKTTQLGTGFGLALGAKLARPEWTAVNVMGDAAFGMVGMDVETAVRADIPILTVILNNGLMGGYVEYMPNAVERYGAHRLGGDYAGVAAALGAHAERVSRPDELAAALRRCLTEVDTGRPALLEVATREEAVFAL